MSIRPTAAVLAANPLAQLPKPSYSFKIHGGSVELSPALEKHIREEFRNLNTAHPSIPFDDVPGSEFYNAVGVALRGGNANYNRYPDILPFEANRFKYRHPSHRHHPDLYFNASIVLGGRAIACQAPKERECKRFWRMVWEFNAPVVVMATNFTEKGKSKCDRYFPSKNNESLPFAHEDELPSRRDLTVTKIKGPEISANEMSSQPAVTVRTIQLIKGEQTKEVTHVHIENWSDQGTTTETTLVDAVRLVGDSPFVGHCSAGIGRIGVFIAIVEASSQYNALSGRPLSPKFIYDIVVTLRSKEHGRNGMVQTEEQYLLIFKTLILLNENFGRQLCGLLS